jgi:uncharacterized protein YydD (DUF2326 family)
MLYLSKIYCNFDTIFPQVNFHKGLNVVFASVTKGLDSKDSHSLGKTTLIDLINYMLIKQANKSFFLRKNKEFNDFVFYLEIKTEKKSYVTIKREVAGKISLHISEKERVLVESDSNEWKHYNLGVRIAQEKLNELISLPIVKDLGFSYRSGLRYCMRRQTQYEEIFKVNTSRERDLNWKPYLSGLLGISSKLVAEKYEANARATNVSNAIKELQDIPTQSTQGLEAEIAQLQQSLKRKQKELDEFNFEKSDQGINTSLVREISQNIASRNKEIYSITHKIQAIDNSLKADFNFDLKKVLKLFEEIQIHFPENLIHSYNDLIELNKQMTIGRKGRLKRTRKRLVADQTEVQSQLTELNETQKKLSLLLIEKSLFDKFKILQAKFSREESRLAVLEERLKQADTASTLQKTLGEIEQRKSELSQQLDAETRMRDNQTLEKAVKLFSEYVEIVLNINIFFFAETNKEGNVEFRINLKDQSSVTDGFSYTRVISAIFDLMLLSLYHDKQFYRFVYHDGLLESLDDRVKVKLIKLWRKTAKKQNLQLIISVLDSDLPIEKSGEKHYFKENEIIRELHDRGNNGRLFRMDAF